MAFFPQENHLSEFILCILVMGAPCNCVGFCDKILESPNDSPPPLPLSPLEI
jgi:hypothetical protein